MARKASPLWSVSVIEEEILKHHYIPQFYLKPWLGADNKLTEYRLLLVPRKKVEKKRRGTNETGWEKNLYTIPGATQQTRENVERIFMGMVDAKAAQAHNMLLLGQIPDGELRVAWARFLLSLVVRRPEEIRRFRDIVRRDFENPDSEFRLSYARAREADWPQTPEEYLEQSNPSMVGRVSIIVSTRLIQNPNIIRMMVNFHWDVVDVDASPMKLATSDHPLFLRPLQRPGACFWIPLSPTKLFVAHPMKSENRDFAKVSVRKMVLGINRTVVGQARKSVYCLESLPEYFVEMGIGKLPTISPHLR